jgi:hypothetical protein
MKTTVSNILEFVDKFEVEALYKKIPDNEREWSTEIWLKHPLERISDYRNFVECYLPIPAQYRNVKMSWHIHIYLNPKVEGMTWDEIRKKQPTSNWYSLSKGLSIYSSADLNVHSKKKIVPYTWKQRAAEFYKVKKRIILNDFLAMRNDLIEGEVEFSIDTLDLFDKMFYKWRDQKLQSGKLDIIPDVLGDDAEERLSALATMAEQELIDLRDFDELRKVTEVRNVISEYARRSMSLTNVIKEDPIKDNDKEYEVEFVNDYGLSDSTPPQKYEDDLTTEELLKQLEARKTFNSQS